MIYDELFKILGTTIRSYRKKLNMTQAELAKGICSTAHITHMENGIRTPNAIILYQIAERLKVPMELLFQPADSMQQHMISGLIRTIVSGGENKKLEEFVSYLESNASYISKSDQLLIDVIKVFMSSQESKEYIKGAKEMDNLLEEFSNYHDYLTDIEFTLICASNWLYYLSGDIEYAFLKLKEVYYKIPNVIITDMSTGVIKFFTQISAIAIDRGSYDLALRYIGEGMELCKEYANHVLLPEFFFHKGEAMILKGDKKSGETQIQFAIKLSESVYVRNKNFLDYIQPRIDRLKL